MPQPKLPAPPIAPVLAGGAFPDLIDPWAYQQSVELAAIAADPAQDTSGDSGSSRRPRVGGVPPLNSTLTPEGPGGAWFSVRTTTVAYQMAVGLANTASKQGAPAGQ